MGEIAQPLRRFVSVERKHRIDGLPLGFGQVFSAALPKAGNAVLAAVRVIEFTHHRTVGPSFDLLGKECVIVPHERPCLTVVDQLLQLPCGHWTLPPKDVGGDIENTGHSIILILRLSTRFEVADGPMPNGLASSGQSIRTHNRGQRPAPRRNGTNRCRQAGGIHPIAPLLSSEPGSTKRS